MKLSKSAKIAVFSIPVFLGIYLIWRQLKKPKKTAIKNITEKKVAIAEVKNTPKTIPNPTPTCSYPLKKGLYNCNIVGQLQKALNSYPDPVNSRVGPNPILAPLTEDGDFGAKTEDYLQAVTSELAINRNSTKVTYTWSTVPTEADFVKLVDEITQAVIDKLSPPLTPDWEHNPLNPLHL